MPSSPTHPNADLTARHRCGHVQAGWVVLLAISLLALPTFYRFMNIFWSRPDDTHEPMVLMGVLYAFWEERGHFQWQAGVLRQTIATLVSLVGALFYAFGSAQDFYQLEGGGLLLFVYGCLLLVTNHGALRRISLLSLLAIFVIPLPSTLMDQVLLPLKLVLTNAVVTFFYWLHYPIASHGVVISVSFYQLQIADACAGLRSVLALTAIGLLFIHFVPSRSRVTSPTLILLIPVIALFANFCRLSVLVLLTYYIGGDFSERAHNIAGYAEIGLTLGIFFGMHKLIERLFAHLPAKEAQP